MGAPYGLGGGGENVLISGERLFQNDTNRVLGKAVSLVQMALNPRFHQTALRIFEMDYNRSRRKDDRATGTFQIQNSRF